MKGATMPATRPHMEAVPIPEMRRVVGNISGVYVYTMPKAPEIASFPIRDKMVIKADKSEIIRFQGLYIK